jgi:hypothetical protein
LRDAVLAPESDRVTPVGPVVMGGNGIVVIARASIAPQHRLNSTLK